MKTLGLFIAVTAALLLLCPVCGSAAAQSSDGFAIYLYDGGKDAPPIISSADIVSFDWAKQSFVLKTGAEKKLEKVPVGSKFTAKVGEYIVYTGKFMSRMSSMAAVGPVIALDTPKKANTYDISLGYPALTSTKDKTDPRWNPIIKDSLAKAGKLTTVAPMLAVDKAYCDWLLQTMQEIGTIKTKMQLDAMFDVEGGLQVSPPTRYVYRKCHYIMIDVTFDADGTLKRVSEPHLGYEDID